jgi:hypothetical protein
MKANNKAKWIVGLTGAAFSAFVIGQLNTDPAAESTTNPTTAMAVEINESMSEREKELVGLDWSDYSLPENSQVGNTNNNQRTDTSDRTTRRT